MPDEPYNLIRKRWIPVFDEDGNVWDIAPWEITASGGPNDKLPTGLAAPRPDFDGALIQFLIGLVQTAFAPKTERAWRIKFKTPPKADELKAAFERYEHAFNLDGEGPRFMQDYDFAHGRIADRTKEEKISKLLIDAASDVTRYFNKSLSESQLDHASAAAALFAFQINDPGIGSGHRKSLRGGGPLTTLVLGKTLWQTIWLNILNRRDLEIRGASQEWPDEGNIFPWMAPTRTSSQDQNTTSDDIHPLQMYWSMSSRILLESVKKSADPRNYLTEVQSDTVFGTIKKKNHGANYTGPWTHPLTPYGKKGPVLGNAEVLELPRFRGQSAACGCKLVSV